jgi:hypothetical protein
MATISKKIHLSKPELSWAKIVSDVLSPPIVWAFLIVLVGHEYTATSNEALYWSAIFVVLICFLPLAYIVGMVATGKIGDLHMRRRQDRYKPLLLTMVSGVVAWLFLKSQGAPPAFSVFALITVAQISVIFLVTLTWQISMHAMAITSATIATAAVFGVTVGFWMVPIIVLVGAARLSLSCHTPWQIFAGAMVGAWVPTLMVLLLDDQWMQLV